MGMVPTLKMLCNHRFPIVPLGKYFGPLHCHSQGGAGVSGRGKLVACASLFYASVASVIWIISLSLRVGGEFIPSGGDYLDPWLT